MKPLIESDDTIWKQHPPEPESHKHNQPSIVLRLHLLTTSTALPDPASVLADHGIPCFTAERMLEVIHVLDYAIHSPLSGRMRVGRDHRANQLRPPQFAPDACVA